MLSSAVGRSSLRARARSRALSAVLATSLAATAAIVGVVADPAAPRAEAAPPVACTNAIYLTDNTSGNIRQFNLTSTGGTLGGAIYNGKPGTTAPNQLGFTAGGTAAISADGANIYKYDLATETRSVGYPKTTGAGTIAGAINPQNGYFYYGGYGFNGGPADVLTLFAFNPTTNTSTTAPVAQITAPDAPGGNGDIAFNAVGDLFFVASGATTNPSGARSGLYRFDGPIPTSGAARTGTATQLTLSTVTGASATNGIAFGSDGFLYLGSSTVIAKANPITGATINSTTLTGVASTDLGSCATPSEVTVATTVPARNNPGDQFTTTITGGGYPPATPPSGTTTGTDTGPQTDPGEVARGLVIPGEPYTVTVTGAGSTNLDSYVPSYQCVNDVTGAVVSSGPGASYTYTPPTAGSGTVVSCSVTMAQPAPSIALAKTVSPTTFTTVGQTLTYSFAVRNTGNTVLDNYSVADTMPGLSGLTCSPAQGSTLQPDGTASCTATYTVTPADIAAGANKTNNATARGVPPAAQGSPVTGTGSATSAYAATPPSATDDAANTPFNTAVDLPASGNDTAGSAPILPASTVFTSAAATNNGKDLTTAQGAWHVNANGTVTFTPAAGYTGTTPPVQYRITDTNGLTATANLRVTVRTGPTAGPDTPSTTQDQDVTFDPLANDVPGPNADGSAGSWDRTTVVFDPANIPPGSTVTGGGKTLTVPGEGTYTIDPVTGQVTFDPLPTFFGPASPVGYTVNDSHGNPASSTIRLTVTAVGPTATDDAVSTPFSQAVDLPAATNDLAGPGGAIDPSRTVLTSPAATNGGKDLTTPQGAWHVNGNGTVTFTPAPGYTGTTPPVEYRVTDTNGQSDTGDLRVTVRPGPVSASDTATTKQNVNVEVTPFANDTPSRNADGSSGTFDPTSVVFPTAGQPDGATVSPDGKTLTVPGEGVYTIDAATGVVTFDPAPTFTGPASPVAYRVTDSVGNQSGSTIRITVDPVSPVLGDDAVKTPFGDAVTFNPLDNDRPGDPSAPLDPSSVRFTSPDATDGGTRLVVPDQGVWQVNPDGTITFTPDPTFRGQTTPPVQYQVTDANGTTATATATVVVGEAPLGAPDQATTPQNTTVTIPVLDNDIPGDEGSPCTSPGNPPLCDTGTFDPSTVVFPGTGQPGGATPTDGGRTLVIPGEGTYTIDPDSGDVTFDPLSGFTGTASPVTYQVTDSYENTATATITVTVNPIRPSANDDSATTPFNTAVTLPGSQDDSAGDPQGGTPAPLVHANTAFPDGGQPATAVISPDRKQLTVPGEGVYVINGDGTVTFTPEPGFASATTPVTYRIEDANGTTATAQLFVTVEPGPEAADDRRTTAQNVDVTVPVLGNDTPGLDANGDPGDWDPTSIVFPTAGQPEGAEVTDGGKTLTVPGEGVYTANDDGTVTFDPAPRFRGEASPITYTATDSLNNPASAQVIITVTAIDPTANDDAAVTPYDTPVTFDFAGNDVPGADSAPIDPASGTFEPGDNPPGATISPDGRTITVPDQGSWTLNEDGTVTFTPEPGFTGPATPVTYTVRDANGTPDTAQLSVTVRPGPTAVDDDATTAQNVDVTVDVLGDDTPGLNADGTPGEWDTGSVRFLPAGQPEGAEITDGGKTLTVPGEGVYTVEDDGTITFDPAPRFRGEASPVSYTVTDSLGNDASAQLTITVDPIDPVANDDSANTPYETPVTFDIAGNDDEGADSAPIDPASATFEAADAPAGWTVSGNGKTISNPDQGSFTLNDDGTVTFTPADGYDGTTTPVTYTIRDTNGTPDTAQISVTVRPGPVAVDDEDTTPQNVDVTVDVLEGDTPGFNADGTPGTWDESSVVFPAGGQPEGAEVSADGRTLTVPGEGEYTIGVDGSITFDPEPQFTGEASPVTYRVTDSLGNDASAQLTITVGAINPVANDDAASTPFNTPVSLPGATDDTAGADSAPIVAELTVFPTTGQPEGAEVSADGRTITVPGEGAYVIQGDGSVVFTPEDGFIGDTTPVTYRIEDSNGTRDTAQLTVTVRRGPTASPDDATTPQAVDVTVPVLDNDSAGLRPDGEPGEFDEGSVVFTEDGQPDGAEVSADGKTLTVPGEGEYTVNPDGTITFSPEPQFTGDTTPVTYRVTDEFGNDVSSTLVVTVAPIAPVATDDAAGTPYNTPVTLPGTTNDAAGATTAPLVPGATVFPTAGQPDSAQVSLDGKTLTMPGQGTWTILADGSVTFTPVNGFTGTTTPVTYRIEDSNGTTDTATLTVTVRPGPKAVNDTGTTPQNVDLTVTVLGNDVPGPNADGSPGSWVAGSVIFTTAGQPNGATVSADGKTLTVPGEGTYQVNEDGTITFDPVPAFTGTASPVTYAVTDNHGNTATATLTITVTPVAPAAVDDRETTPHNTPVLIDVLGNDTPGSTSATFDPSTLRLIDPATGQEVTRVVVRGEGVWTVVDGQVRFEPEKDFTGTATPIDYAVRDSNGTRVTATITVVVGPAGKARPDDDQTTPNTPVTVDVLDNDQAAPDEDMVPGSVCLLPGTANGKAGADGGDDGKCVKRYTLDGVGTWVVNADGTITFTPAKGYTGTASIDYTVTDTGDNVYQSTLTVTVKGDGEVSPGQGDDDNPFLPDTGGPQALLALTALGLLGVGGALILASRRRRQH